MTPTLSQIKADVAALMPGMIERETNRDFDGNVTFYWLDTRQEITPREWMAVAHEAVGILDGFQRDLMADHLVDIVKPGRTDSYNPKLHGSPMLAWHGVFKVAHATDDQRLEAIHRVMFPDKWRDA